MSNATGWNAGTPLLVLGTRNIDFTGEDGKRIAFSTIEFLDGNAPEHGTGLRVLTGRCDDLNITPGWFLGVVSMKGNRDGQVKTSVKLSARLGDLPALTPPGMVTAPVEAPPASPAPTEGRGNGRTATATA